MNKPTVQMRLLGRAVEIVGSQAALARRLQVPTTELFAWLKGDDRPTQIAFLTAVDIIIEHGDGTPGSEELKPQQAPIIPDRPQTK